MEARHQPPYGSLLSYVTSVLGSLTASIMHCNSSEAPTRLVVFLGQRTSDDVPDAVPSGQYDPTGHLFCASHVSVNETERCSGSTNQISNRVSL